MEQNDFVVVFFRNLRNEWNKQNDAHNNDLDGNDQATNQVTDQVAADREKKILDFCIVPRSRAEIQEHIGIANRGYFRTEILEPLLKRGKLARTIPEKPNSQNQKYVTVEQ